jgi:hypothetical protein
MSAQTPRGSKVALFLPPVAALILAAGYLHWQATDALNAASALCARFQAGDPLADFRQAAGAVDFEISGDAPASRMLIAGKTIYRLAEESYRCTAQNDGINIVSLNVSVVTK